MRNLLYKNLTFPSRGSKIIASSEEIDKQGVHSVVRRHFAYIVKPVQNTDVIKSAPYLFVLKERNTKEKREHFFCKVKGCILALDQGKLFKIYFVHALSVDLTTSLNLSGQIG